MTNKDNELLEELLKFEKEYEKHRDKINEKNKELENIINYKIIGSLVHSCSKWINDFNDFNADNIQFVNLMPVYDSKES